MSLSFNKLEPVCVRDPRTLVSDHARYAVLKAGSQTTFKQYTTQSVSPNSLQFTCPPPSGGIFVDRNVRLYLPVRLTFTGTPAIGQTLLRAGYDAPRAFGLHSAMENIIATINNQSVSINPAEVIQPLMWYNTSDDLKSMDYSTTPCYQDQSQSYDSLVGSVRNPLANYSNGLDNCPQPRGSFPFVVVSNPAGDGVNPVTAEVDVAFNESLYLSPFWWGRGVSNEAFFNVVTMNFTFTFLQQAANRFWSHSSSGGVSFATVDYSFTAPISFSTTSGNVPYMLFTYLTPQETQKLSPSLSISYPYFVTNYYNVVAPPVAAGLSINGFTSSNIQLSSIPRRMYIFVRKQDPDLFGSPENTDTYFAITNLSIQFQNQNGLLASANMQQLYEMSVKNGCTMSWAQWSGKTPSVSSALPAGGVGTVGSVVCVEFGTDIGLGSLDAPGKLCQAMLQVTVNATNVSAAAIAPSLYVIVISEGVFTIEGLNRSSAEIAPLTSKDIIDCTSSSHVDYRDLRKVNGGDFFSGIKEGLNRVAAIAPTVAKYAKPAHDLLRSTRALSSLAQFTPAAPAAPFLRTLGYGEGEGEGEGVLAGRMRRKHRVQFGRGGGEGEGEGEGEGMRRKGRRGGVVIAGGEGLSREELARRILY